MSTKPSPAADAGDAPAGERTVRIHRVMATTPAKLYRAFIDADALAKWLPPDGFTCKVHHLEAKEGGTFRMSFTNFTSGNSHFFHGQFLELKPGELVRYTDEFEDPNLPGVLEVTVRFTQIACGTDMKIVQANIPAPIPVESCYLGWQQSMMNLARLVEPNIPG